MIPLYTSIMFFPRVSVTKIAINDMIESPEELLARLDEYGYLYVQADEKPTAILLSMNMFKKLHAYAQDKIMDKLRSYDGY